MLKETTKQYITRRFEFDAGHRVMNERMKCFSNHGHRYVVKLRFVFDQMESIGYAIDFKEIKRVGCQWIDDLMDHGTLLNPHDKKLIEVLKEINTKIYLMSLSGEGEYCNPTAENISKEIFMAMEILFNNQAKGTGLKMNRVILYETPNCATTCSANSISHKERSNFYQYRESAIKQYAIDKGIIEYDSRKV